MAVICPTITASNPVEYRQQLNKVIPFCVRLHIDLADGKFTPNKLIGPKEVWWPAGVVADIHLMYKDPSRCIKAVIELSPQLVIIQAEADGNFFEIAKLLKNSHIKVGVALLKQTPVEAIKPVIANIDHVMIFSGNLGHQGGSKADLDLIEKAKLIKAKNANIEIGWDGGVNEHNVKALCGAIDVINTGGYIQNAKDPLAAYAKLKTLIR